MVLGSSLRASDRLTDLFASLTGWGGGADRADHDHFAGGPVFFARQGI